MEDDDTFQKIGTEAGMPGEQQVSCEIGFGRQDNFEAGTGNPKRQQESSPDDLENENSW